MAIAPSFAPESLQLLEGLLRVGGFPANGCRHGNPRVGEAFFDRGDKLGVLLGIAGDDQHLAAGPDLVAPRPTPGPRRRGRR